MPDHPIGTDAVLVMEAIDRAWSDDGVLVLMDLGSAVLSAEMALDLMPEERRANVLLLCEAPIVEGAVAAAVTSKLGASLDRVAQEARGGLAGKMAHLGDTGAASEVAPDARAGWRRGDDPADRDRAARPPRPTRGALRPDGIVVRCARHDPRPDERPRSGGRRQPERRGDARGDAGTRDRGRGHRTASVRGAGRDPRLGGARLRRPAGAERGLRRRNAGRRTLARRSGRPGIVRGHPASPGIAIGPARRFRTPDLPIPEGPGAGADAERAAFDAALADVRGEIARQREHVAGMATDDEAEIFDAHLLFLKDAALLAPTRDAIADGGRSAAQAWHDVIERTAAQWDGLEDAYLRARAADLRSVGRQVLARLLGLALPRPALEAPGVVIARDLTPADTVGLDPAMALGIATAAGGPTSHAAVLARSSGIPAVVGAGDACSLSPRRTPVALDGTTGVVHVDPERIGRGRAQAAREARDAVVREAQASALEPARTVDGVTIEVAANIGSPVDAVRAVAAGADGVGLFRTEFLFMGRVGDAGRARAGGGVSRDGRGAGRTSAADPHARRRRRQAAPLPRPAERGEPVPRRARHPARPPTARAPAGAAPGDPAGRRRPSRCGSCSPWWRPWTSSGQAMDLLHGAGERPRGRSRWASWSRCRRPRLLADRLADDADFFSIGTNDLTQYTMAADRGNVRVGALADAVHPGGPPLDPDDRGGRRRSRAMGRRLRRARRGRRRHRRCCSVSGVRELSMGAPVDRAREARRPRPSISPPLARWRTTRSRARAPVRSASCVRSARSG